MLCDKSLNPLNPHQILARPSFLLRPPLSSHQAQRGWEVLMSVSEAPWRPASPLSTPALPSPTLCPHPSDPREASGKQSPGPLAERGGVAPELVSSITCSGLSRPTCLPPPNPAVTCVLGQERLPSQTEWSGETEALYPPSHCTCLAPPPGAQRPVP